ncbi:hypothetical protein NQ315_002960 [Exocentrus adspersus]|uniref:Uncharacterized protein n=1 Tax=Exocentrus adspersus TaxID=1586481 RepID=A0AAV8W4U1_9CUCU|nr:hypothetical protein NQ315_002960 [Exocentrus adspersus]
MVSVSQLAIIILVIHLVEANVTRVSRENVLLSRRRRYLSFPVGSNFIITLSQIKLFLQVQPRGWAMLLEADVPFALPSDTRQFKKTKRYITDRRNFLEQVEDALTSIGLDGEMCTRKIICTVLHYKSTQRKSLVKDLLFAAFVYPEDNSDMHSDMCDESFVKCSVPFLEYITGSVTMQ